MTLPRPFENVFRQKAIYRGSDWINRFALQDKDDETGVITPMDLTGYTVRMTIKPPKRCTFWTTPIVKEFTPVINEFTLELSSEEQISLISDFEFTDIYTPLNASIEVQIFNDTESVIVMRENLMIYHTVRSDN